MSYESSDRVLADVAQDCSSFDRNSNTSSSNVSNTTRHNNNNSSNGSKRTPHSYSAYRTNYNATSSKNHPSGQDGADEDGDGGDISRWLVLGVTTLTVALVAAVYVAQSRSTPPPENDKDLSGVTGWVAVAAAVLIFGSYGILIKSPRVQKANVNTIIFQIYYSTGVALSSLLVLAYTPFVFSWWGVLGAALWVMSQLFAFVGIAGAGYAVAIAVWAGLTIVVSFFWGAVIFGQTVHSIAGAIMALFVLVLGVGGVAAVSSSLPDRIASALCGSHYNHLSHRADSADYHSIFEAENQVSHRISQSDIDIKPEDETTTADNIKVTPLVGLLCAVMVGLFNGSLMAPFHYFKQSQSSGGNASLAYLTSFSFGVMMVTALCVCVFVLYKYATHSPPQFHIRVAGLPGVITGVYLACGNYCSIYATQYLGDTLGYPLTQGAIVVAGLWGILYYKEVSSRAAIVLFAFCVLLIVGGAAMLAVWG